jgi:hypothetical protein
MLPGVAIVHTMIGTGLGTPSSNIRIKITHPAIG